MSEECEDILAEDDDEDLIQTSVQVNVPFFLFSADDLADSLDRLKRMTKNPY